MSLIEIAAYTWNFWWELLGFWTIPIVVGLHLIIISGAFDDVEEE